MKFHRFFEEDEHLPTQLDIYHLDFHDECPQCSRTRDPSRLIKLNK